DLRAAELGRGRAEATAALQGLAGAGAHIGAARAATTDRVGRRGEAENQGEGAEQEPGTEKLTHVRPPGAGIWTARIDKGASVQSLRGQERSAGRRMLLEGSGLDLQRDVVDTE